MTQGEWGKGTREPDGFIHQSQQMSAATLTSPGSSDSCGPLGWINHAERLAQ